MSSLGMLDRFRYWRWLGNGSSSDDHRCERWIGFSTGVGGMLDRFRYWRWLGNGSSSDDYEFPTFIGVNVGSVSQLALVRNQFSSEKYRLSWVIGGNKYMTCFSTDVG
ncbi:hypothetical protein J6590_085813 [Homalodisca vitripennis]|nr:hypothetical protein J6590_085813 [Homalodisca vitripennis]